jgi:hypothetical protein
MALANGCGVARQRFDYSASRMSAILHERNRKQQMLHLSYTAAFSPQHFRVSILATPFHPSATLAPPGRRAQPDAIRK